jgi:hypothetical protein
LAELVGADTDSERATQWLIALMVLCCDRFAISYCSPRRRAGVAPHKETNH